MRNPHILSFSDEDLIILIDAIEIAQNEDGNTLKQSKWQKLREYLDGFLPTPEEMRGFLRGGK